MHLSEMSQSKEVPNPDRLRFYRGPASDRGWAVVIFEILSLLTLRPFFPKVQSGKTLMSWSIIKLIMLYVCLVCCGKGLERVQLRRVMQLQGSQPC